MKTKRKQSKVGTQQSETLKNIPIACVDELKAVEFIEEQRWGDTPCCPRCGDMDIRQMRDKDTGERNKRFLWFCNGCRKQFTVKIGTVMEDSRIPYHHWCFAFWAACSSKKGVSALQISRQTGLSYKSALFLMHRIRFAMTDDHATPELMTGEIEVDESYVGGKEKNKHANKKARAGRGPVAKTPVVAMVKRRGQVRAQVMPKVNGRNLKAVMQENIDPSATVYTDDASYYSRTGHYFAKHESVNHSAGEYVRGSASTNTIESFFAILKRGVIGTFHNISPKHLHRYIGEFEYKYNTRDLDDGERTVLAIQKSNGKRLMYREPANP